MSDQEGHAMAMSALQAAASRCDFRLAYTSTPTSRAMHQHGIDGPDLPNAYWHMVGPAMHRSQAGGGDWNDEEHPDADRPQAEHIDRWALTAVREAVHEVLEWFYLDGRPWLDPHGPLEAALHQASEELGDELLALAPCPPRPRAETTAARRSALEIAAERCDYRLTFTCTPRSRRLHGFGIDGPSMPNACWRPGQSPDARLPTVLGSWEDPQHPDEQAPQQQHIDQWVHSAVAEGVHEALEWFSVDGRPRLDPHGEHRLRIGQLCDQFVDTLIDRRPRGEASGSHSAV